MDEKTAMTVEFLRARLLSERIVSRSARQRTEMLAQRVMELEEQLRIVNIQRKKAEKAAEEVLSILETQGITCLDGLTDSSTDQENNQHTEQEGNNCILSKDIKEDESLAPSRLDRSKVYDSSSLSWKSHGCSLDSQQKQKTKMNRHRQNNKFIISMKPSQRFPGKSCRKIKRHDAGSASENELERSPLLDAHGNGVVSHPGDFEKIHECLLGASESKTEKFSVNSSLFCSNNQSSGNKDVCGNDDGMERALEQQSQLIVQFQAMEKAQRDWEEEFNQTKMPMLENPEPCKGENSNLVGWIPQHEEEEASSAKDISFTEDKKSERCRNCEMDNRGAESEKTTAINVIETVPEPFTSQPPESPDLTRKAHLRPSLEKPNARPISDKKVHPHERNVSKLDKNAVRVLTIPLHETPGSTYEKSNAVIPSNSKLNPPGQGLFPTPLKEQLTSITKEKISMQRSPATCSSLGSVLESLHRAKTSLKQELVKIPCSGQVMDSPMKPTSSCNALDFSIPSSVLFRLPPNSFTRSEFSGPRLYGSGLRLTATRPNLEFVSSNVSGDQSRYTSPYPKPGKDYANQYPFNNPYKDGSRVQVHEECPLYYPGLSTKAVSFHNDIPNPSSNLRRTTPFSDRRSYGGCSGFSSFD